jgi:hypothetical protein
MVDIMKVNGSKIKLMGLESYFIHQIIWLMQDTGRKGVLMGLGWC